jgi:hypothetical protein
MLRLPFADERDLPEALQAVRKAQREHGVVALPTETFYGSRCPDDPVALDRVSPSRKTGGEGAAGGGASISQLDPLVVVPRMAGA